MDRRAWLSTLLGVTRVRNDWATKPMKAGRMLETRLWGKEDTNKSLIRSFIFSLNVFISLMDFYCYMMLWLLQYSDRPSLPHRATCVPPTQAGCLQLHSLLGIAVGQDYTLSKRHPLRANWVRQGYSLQANSPLLGTTLDNSFRDNASSGAPWALPEALAAPSLGQFLPILTLASFTSF